MAGKAKIGAGLALDGEKEFKQAISGINKDLSVLGSEMGKVTAQFGSNANSMDSLKAKSEVYNKQIDEQKKKIETLKAALANSAEEFGENDVKTKNWQISLNKAEAQLAKTENAAEDNKETIDKLGKELDDTGDSADKAGGKFNKLGGVLKAAGVAMAAVGAAAVVGAAALGKAVLTAYGDYEQLVGGIDTLFKDSSAEMQKYAANAYKTAGLSANEYMETVTGFSASLIQSLDGDTEKAVKYADMAITDMSDNANKMGTDMASIQNAYQGFAKMNYTMLDNLRLGYGGTKAEMERLLVDAGKIAGVKFDISSYADVVEAIHIMQDSMGIAGTTALEAEETIQGSMSAMSSAWANMLVGFGDADADMGMLSDNLVDAFGNVVKNVVPVIQNIADALPNAIEAMLPAVGSLLPQLLETATTLFKQVLDALLNILPELIPVAVESVMTIVDTIVENLPLIIDSALELVVSLAEGIVEALPELIPAAVDTVMTIVDTLIDNIEMLIDASIAIILALADGLIESLPKLIEKAPEIVKKLVTAIVDNAPKLLDAARELLASLIKGITNNLSNLGATAGEMVTTVVKGITDMLPKILNVGKDIVRGVWDGIKSMTSWFASQIKGFFTGIVDGAKKVLGIASPSKVFAGIGENMALGLGEGFETEMDGIGKKINSSIPTSIEIGGNYNTDGSYDKGYGQMVRALSEVMFAAFESLPQQAVDINLDGTKLGRALFPRIVTEQQRLGLNSL